MYSIDSMSYEIIYHNLSSSSTISSIWTEFYYEVYYMPSDNGFKRCVDRVYDDDDDFNERIKHVTSQLKRLEEEEIPLKCCDCFFEEIARKNLGKEEECLVNTVSRMVHTPQRLEAVIISYIAKLEYNNRKELYDKLPSLLKSKIDEYSNFKSTNYYYTSFETDKDESSGYESSINDDDMDDMEMFFEKIIGEDNDDYISGHYLL